MTCGICRRSQKDGFKKIKCDGIESVEKCPGGDIPKLSRENKKAWWLLNRMLPGFYSAQGGFDYSVISLVFNLYNVPAGQRPILYDKFIHVIDAVIKMRKKNKAES